MIGNILKNIHDELKINIHIQADIIQKKTVRSLKKYILLDEKNSKYLLEIATDSNEIFYLKRTIKFQEEFEKLGSAFLLNKPIVYDIGNKYSYALYHYFDALYDNDNNKPIEQLEKIYARVATTVKINDETVEKVLKNFISAWPNQYHSFIKRQPEFQYYKKLLYTYKEIKVAFEHGDYTKNNILLANTQMYLMDFEFYREFQPIGFDLYDYYKSRNKNSNTNDYFELHKIKYNLINTINNAIDKNITSHQIYNSFEDSVLMESWKELYDKGANYNLSPIWCKTWCKYYLQNKELFIFTIWNDSELVLLLPLYRKNKTLFLIGSEPDLFDSFDLLYTHERYVVQFFEYCKKNLLDIDFRYIDSETQFAKMLIKYFYQNNLKYDSEIIDTKPKTVLKEFNPKSKEKSDIVRCKNRAKNNFGNELIFEYQCKKTVEEMNDFIDIHKDRWAGGPFVRSNKFENFIKDISQNDFVVLSKLSLDNIPVAYHFAYMDSNNQLNSVIPSYAKKYDDISPGKVLLYDLVQYTKDNQLKVFDFGRGAEGYKYWFSTESHVLFHLKSNMKRNPIRKLKNLLIKVFNKMERIIYG